MGGGSGGVLAQEVKNAQKVKKITIIYHYLLEEDSNGQVYSPRKFLKFEARKCHFLHSEHPNLL
jgi:hypothetical protein